MNKKTQRRPLPPKSKSGRLSTTVKIRADLYGKARHFALDHGLTWGDVLDEALEIYLRQKGA